MMGQSLLSRLPASDVQRRLAGVVEDAGPVDMEAVQAALEAARRAGIATGGSVLTPGITTVSAAILAPSSGDLMAFAIAFPNSAADSAMCGRITDAMFREVMALGQAVGDPVWSKAAGCSPARQIR
jgi:DNA-binding IclR family transcriptional regulator